MSTVGKQTEKREIKKAENLMPAQSGTNKKKSIHASEIQKLGYQDSQKGF